MGQVVTSLENAHDSMIPDLYQHVVVDECAGDDNTAPSAPSSTPLSRWDMLVLECTDSFELLTPDEQEEDKLDFHATPIDFEEHRVFHPAKIGPTNAAVSSLQTQNRCDPYGSGYVTQEIMIAPSCPPGWLGEAKGRGKEHSLDLDDLISQVPCTINGHSLVSSFPI